MLTDTCIICDEINSSSINTNIIDNTDNSMGDANNSIDSTVTISNVFEFVDTDNVLFVGEGNFSFCASVIRKHIAKKLCSHWTRFTATCFEKQFERNSEIKKQNIEFLTKVGGQIYYKVDATKLHQDERINYARFTKIIFMFPHVGGKMKIQLNRSLVQGFLGSAHRLIAPSGCVVVTLCKGQGGTPFDCIQRVAADTWKVVELGAEEGMVLTQVEKLNVGVYSQYSQVGYRSLDKGFHVEGSIIHVFKSSPLKNFLPINLLPNSIHCLPLDPNLDIAATFAAHSLSHASPDPVSLYPPTYTHHLSFWLTPHQPLTDVDVVRLVLSCLPGLVTSWRWIDEYQKDGKMSKTAEITYKSENFALGPTAAYNLHYNVLGKSLQNVFNVQLR